MLKGKNIINRIKMMEKPSFFYFRTSTFRCFCWQHFGNTLALATFWERYFEAFLCALSQKKHLLGAYCIIPKLLFCFIFYCVALPDELSRHVFGLILSLFLKYHRYSLATDWQHRAFLSPYFRCLSADERMC